METPKTRRCVARRFVAPPAETPFAGEQPYVANEKFTPSSRVAAALKRKAQFAAKAATPGAVRRFLFAGDRITPYFALPTCLDKWAGSDGVAGRASKYVNNNICSAGGAISRLISRRDRKSSLKE